jgi:hypothetical protein
MPRPDPDPYFNQRMAGGVCSVLHRLDRLSHGIDGIGLTLPQTGSLASCGNAGNQPSVPYLLVGLDAASYPRLRQATTNNT